MERSLGHRTCAVGSPDITAADEEARLLQRAQRDPAAFAQVYERYLPRVYRYCLRRLGTPEDAEDATAVVFTRALAGLAGYRGGSAAAWLFQIAHHTVANALRARRPTFSLDYPLRSGACDPISPERGALEQVVHAEEHQQLARALATLSSDQRELLALRLAGELSAREIGVILGKREGAVRVALHRALQQVRAALPAQEDDPDV
jgi:RNA polymerase sigma-70 factor (ECF subfamily)